MAGKLAAFAALAILATSPSIAIEGDYSVEGLNPAQNEELGSGQTKAYKGQARVKRTGQTYTVVWKIGRLPQLGTGIVVGTTFSVVFQTFVPGTGFGRPGVAVFHIENDRIAQGVWTVIGQPVTGQETWTPVDRP